jgi:hypothetical protein
LICEDYYVPAVFVELDKLGLDFSEQPAPICATSGELCLALWGDDSVILVKKRVNYAKISVKILAKELN